ncbi:zinc transporter ZIP13 [Eurytemora carolleeae]|uniref:zinc transporter ZIP13 n=1 Tax=Eurytemora carolleeae TaxID=1294199 RepID=UPI000C771024|nr:zinc transporter ZIP13 [Eurytemora carolleeae]XP_023327117.1 zinc transporter ZIP13 [Eurytemora carolleeae]|eukprot:XP_023327109.1 zinc transporter ZIP13-like [Eurytemora affinis]
MNEEFLGQIEGASRWTQWLGAVFGAILVGLSGVLPLLVVPKTIAKDGKDRMLLNIMLGFAVGGLLGDVFLHLLPEAYQQAIDSGEETGLCKVGWSIITGILVFLFLEKLLEISNPETDESRKKEENKKVLGYLNLMANCTDNLLHGLAVGTSFLTSWKLGLTTTFAILVHEIPHEFGDFAILLNAGFDRWDAAKAQMSTALIGMLGALLALGLDSNNDLSSLLHNILPFTAGGFLNIALVTVLPTLMEENRPWPAFLQFVSVIAGLISMYLLTN